MALITGHVHMVMEQPIHPLGVVKEGKLKTLSLQVCDILDYPSICGNMRLPSSTSPPQKDIFFFAFISGLYFTDQ